MTLDSSSVNAGRSYLGSGKVLALLFAEVLFINAVRHYFGFECHKEDLAFCKVAKQAMLATYGIAATVALLALFSRRQIFELLSEAGLRKGPLLANVTGLAVLATTLPALRWDLSATGLFLVAALWILGAGLLVLGSLFLLAPTHRWRAFFQSGGLSLIPVILAGAFAPFAALQLRALWSGELLAGWTFEMVTQIMAFWGQPVQTFPEQKIIGSDDFMVNIAPSCSGIEGLALTTIFSLMYLTLFREELRFPRAFIILPIGLALSWLFNSVRIAVLVQIGIAGYPELAVGGFHSHAGWLAFTVLSLGIVFVTQSIPFVRKPQLVVQTHTSSFLRDPTVVLILPFFVFVCSSLVVSTFAENASAYYPIRALAMAAVLSLVWPSIKKLPWRVDPLAVGAGAFIAAYWVYFAPPNVDPPPYAGFGAAFVVVWIVCRLIGTSLFVPIIEELFFRGYLLDRLGPAGSAHWRVIAAIVISSVFFAALHGRYVEAALAGVIFALVKLRSGNITDAIIAHMVANALIAAWAVGMQDWGAI